jgi:26S proteasome regulatory subunit N5
LLNEQVQLLSKKHGQLKQAITNMVQVVMDFLDEAPNEESKMSTIETLRTVTEGKVRTSRTAAPRLPLTIPTDLRRS